MAILDDGTKFCPKCKIFKPADEFGKKKDRGDGLRGQCRACESAYARKVSNPVLKKIRWASYYAKNSAGLAAKSKARYEAIRDTYLQILNERRTNDVSVKEIRCVPMRSDG